MSFMYSGFSWAFWANLGQHSGQSKLFCRVALLSVSDNGGDDEEKEDEEVKKKEEKTEEESI